MAKQLIDVGVNLNDGTGDNLRTAGEKINSMMSEIYSTFGNGTVLTATINGLQNVRDDSDPQLGGLLDLDGYGINGIGEIFISGRIATGSYIEAGGNISGGSLTIANNSTIGGALTIGGVTSGTVGNFSTSVTTYTLNATNELQVTGPGTFDGIVTARGAASKLRFYYADSNAFPAAADWEGGLAFSEAANKMSVATDGSWKTLALEDSPSFTGTPTAPTAATTTNTTQIATTAYVQAHRTEINNALDLKAPLASPALTGNPTAPTPAKADNDTSIATTAFVKTVVDDYAPLVSPALSGTPTAPTPSPANDNSTKIATTAFVAGREEVIQGKLDAKAPLASPALTGIPTAPTAAANINNTQIATTAYVTRGVGDAVTTINTALALKAPLASPALTGEPTAPTPTVGSNNTRIATAAFVKTAIDNKVTDINLSQYAKRAAEFEASIGGSVPRPNLITFKTFSGPGGPQGTLYTWRPCLDESPPRADDSTNIATTAFTQSVVSNAISDLNIGNYAPINNPVLTGTPTAPTAPVNDNSTKIANTEWVQREQAYFDVPKWGGARKHVSASVPSSSDGSNGDLWFQTGTDSNVTMVSAVEWANVLNKPGFFSGDYNALYNKPSLFSGAWADISGKPADWTVATTPVYDNGVDWGFGTYARNFTFRIKWDSGYDARELATPEQFVVKIALFDEYQISNYNTSSQWAVTGKRVDVYRNGYSNYIFTIQSNADNPSPRKIILTIYKIGSPAIHHLVLLSNQAIGAPTPEYSWY